MKLFFIFLLFFIFIGFSNADIPVREEQFIYSIMAFNGKDFSGTYCSEKSDTIYLMADQDNFINARKTLVYYWPISGEWKADISALNYPFDGTLELTQKSVDKQIINSEKYTFFNILGKYDQNWKVAIGDEAETIQQHYQNTIEEYQLATFRYQREKRSFDMIMDAIVKQVAEIRDSGTDISDLMEELRTLKAPVPPNPPDDYVVPPSPVQRAFIMNLPSGEYSIRFINKDNTVMEGSEKRVVVFEKRRGDGIGFEVIPGDKWTRSVESKSPSSVLYVDGTTDLYLRPFFQDEYNDLYYKKMLKNDAKGNPNLMNWVHIQQVPDGRITLTGTFYSETIIQEKPFFVEQAKGSVLGYQIVPFDPVGAHKDKEPSLIAYRVPVSREKSLIKIKFQNKDGLGLINGNRQIRVIIKSQWQPVLLFFCLLPLLVMVIVQIIRSRKYTL